jgi:hypothetical protein
LKNFSSPVNRKEIISATTPPYVRHIANQISNFSGTVSKQVSTMPRPTNTNKNQTNTAKLKQITQQRDALQLTVRNLRKENSKLSQKFMNSQSKMQLKQLKCFFEVKQPQ